jgi:hypothetical protein
MNKLRKFSFVVALAVLLVSIAGSTVARAQSSSSGDEFFVISSVDRAHNALVLLTPKQIATSYQVTDKTQYVDENGRALKLADLRAGDTLFASYDKKSDGTLTVSHIRKGMMTVDELRRRYSPGLPPNAGQATPVRSSPKSSAPPKSSNSASGSATKSGTPKSNSSTSKAPKSGNSNPNGAAPAAPKTKQHTPHQ